jgi:hypothetical protein
MVARSVIALVAATAGYPTTFTVTVRDSFGNPSDSHSVQRYVPLGTPSPATTNPTSVRFEIVVSNTVIRKVSIISSVAVLRSHPSLRCPSSAPLWVFGVPCSLLPLRAAP